MTTKPNEKDKLLRRGTYVLNSITKGLDEVDSKTRQKIMEFCGEACAREEWRLDVTVIILTFFQHFLSVCPHHKNEMKGFHTEMKAFVVPENVEALGSALGIHGCFLALQ